MIIENFQTDTADYADILLPGTMQLEHDDMHDSFSHLYLNWNNTAVAPPGECLPHTEIFRQIARKMNLTEPELYASDDELALAALSSKHPAVAGISLDSLKEQGWVRLQWPEPYQPFLKSFFTPSGKFEFQSDRAELDGVGLLPHFTPPAETTAIKAGTLALVSPANNFLLNSMFANSPYHARSGQPIVIVHPKDAKVLNLESEKGVMVKNERGSFNAICKISKETRIGVALTSKGLWAKHHGGSSINATTVERDSDMGRGAIFHDNRVRILPL